MQGIIIRINRYRGYGFIRTESNNEYFFHRTDLVMKEIYEVKEGDRVDFKLDHGLRGLLQVSITLATSIKVIDTNA